MLLTPPLKKPFETMLKDWFYDKVRDHALGASTKELQKFVDALKTMSDENMGAVVAIASVIRINFETNGVVQENIFSDGVLPDVEALGIYQFKINKVARKFRKMGLAADSMGAMVWSYTLRCLNVPELRPLGMAMWVELSRGFPYAKDILKKGEKEKGEPFPDRVWKEWKRIPVGFETLKS